MRPISNKSKYILLEPIHKDQVGPLAIEDGFELVFTFFLEVTHGKLLEDHLYQCENFAFVVGVSDYVNIKMQGRIDVLEHVHEQWIQDRVGIGQEISIFCATAVFAYLARRVQQSFYFEVSLVVK